MSVNFKKEGEKLILQPEGRIDTNTSPAVEAEIDSLRAANPHSEAVLDLENVEYLSSAGLRVVLRLRKNEPTLEVINVASEVYEVFDMTGFTEMMPISKAYRRISVDGCEVIGQGANGKVYRISEDIIVKVYMNPDSLPDIHRERELARRAFVLGIPTAIPYDVVRVGDGYGSVFELLNARSFAKVLAEEPERLDEIVKLNVELMKKIHSTVVRPEDMPDMRIEGLKWVGFVRDYLPEDKADMLVKMMEAVPEDMHMIHGDYHIKNVMLQNGEVLLIDMDTLAHGHPIYELCGMFNAYVGHHILSTSDFNEFLGVPHSIGRAFWQKSLELYLDTDDPARVEEVRKKAELLGYVRLMRRVIRKGDPNSEEGRAKIEEYRKRIIGLLDEVDTFLF